MITLKDLQTTYKHSLNTTKTDKAVNKKQSKTTNKTTLSFDLSVQSGEKVSIIGASGSGKSTLLNLIAGFIPAERGEIWLNGVNHTHSKPHHRPVSMLFQHSNLFSHLNIADNIGIGIKPNLKLSKQQQLSVTQAAEQVGLHDMLDRKPHQLSGGQQQRVALARCLLRDQPILLLDEPFSALDKALRLEMLDLLLDICEQKTLTLLLVTHQPDELESSMDRVIRLD